jgi:hypothetical protein
VGGAAKRGRPRTIPQTTVDRVHELSNYSLGRLQSQLAIEGHRDSRGHVPSRSTLRWIRQRDLPDRR